MQTQTMGTRVGCECRIIMRSKNRPHRLSPWTCGTVVHIQSVSSYSTYMRGSCHCTLSPHLPHTPSQLRDLSHLHATTRRDGHVGPLRLTISHQIAILGQNFASRHALQFQNRGPNKKRWRVSNTQYQQMCAVNNSQAAHQDFFFDRHGQSHKYSHSESHSSYYSKSSSQPNTIRTHICGPICLRWSCFSCRSCLYRKRSPSAHQTRAQCYHTLPVPNRIKHLYTIPVFSNARCRSYDHDRNLFVYL